MQGLLNKVQEKAQASGLMNRQSEQHVDSGHHQSGAVGNTSTTTSTTTGGTPVTGTGKPGLSAQLGQLSQNPQIAQLNHQLRTLQHHYATGSTGPALKGLQIGITAHKGVALDYETLSRDTAMLGKEMDGWVSSLPVGDGAGAQGHVEAGIVGGRESLYDAPPTLTLLNLTTQLSSAQKILSTRLLDARAPLKALREIEQQVDERQIRLKEMEKRFAKKGGSAGVTEVDALREEIRELSLGLGEKREEALVRSEKAAWEAHAEYARNVMVLSHAGTTLIDLFPSASRPQHLTARAGTASPIRNVSASSTLTPGAQLSTGQKKDRVRSIEEGVRKSLAGLDGGWKVSVDDGGLVPHTSSGPGGRISPRPSTGGPAHVPAHVIEESNKPLNADIIGTYPSSHLNNAPAPIPHSPHGSFGQGTAASPPQHGLGALNVPSVHKHRSSFDHPVQASHPSFGAEQQSRQGGAFGDSALSTESPMLNSEAVASHPTVAETGIPVDNSQQGPGPATGQLERREKPDAGQGVVRLNSLGGAGLDQGQQHGQHTGELPGYGEGFAARASAPEKSGEAYPVGSSAGSGSGIGGSQGLPPPPQHPAVLAGTTHAGAASGIEGMTPREQAEYYYKQSQAGR